jgi:dihydrodipicolinate synthase/N-acetylneuraminate lyase
MLTRDTLIGVWAGLPVPWAEDGTFDEATFQRDVQKCCEAGVHGIYTAGTTGEFYAQNFDEFKAITTALLAVTRENGTPTQAGCTGLCTRDVLERATFAVEAGADGLQIALPFWLALTDDEVVAFFRDVAAAVPGVPLIHYDTGRSKRRIEADLYRRLLDVAPDLMGNKYGDSDIARLAHLIRRVPEINFFTGEHILAHAMMEGAKGSYSSLVYLNPRLLLHYFDLCQRREWEAAFAIQRQISVFFFDGLGPLLDDKGFMDSAIDRALGRLAGFLECGLECQPPYFHLSPDDFAALRAWTEANMPELLAL